MNPGTDWKAADLVIRPGDRVTAAGTIEVVEGAGAQFWVRPWWNGSVRRLSGGMVAVTGRKEWPTDEFVRITGTWQPGRIEVGQVDTSEEALTQPEPEVWGQDDSHLDDDEALAWLAAASDAAGPLMLSSGGGTYGLRQQVLYISEELAAWHDNADNAVRLLPSIIPAAVLDAHQERDDIPEYPEGFGWTHMRR